MVSHCKLSAHDTLTCAAHVHVHVHVHVLTVDEGMHMAGDAMRCAVVVT